MADPARTKTGGIDTWAELREQGRDVVAHGVRSFREHDLLSYASALAYQVLLALIPLALTALALLGFLDLEEVWQDQLAPRVRERLQPDSFSVVDRTIDQILGQKQRVWLTFGVAFALWQVSGAIRTTMEPLNRIYDVEEERSWWRRFARSLVLALAVAPLVIGAFATVQLGPRLASRLGGGFLIETALFVGRWAAAVALLALAVWLLLRYAPARAQPFAWAGLGSAFVIVAWIVASLGFGVYVRVVADYRSVFGSLASVIVLMTYLYISALTLLFGVQLDASLRRRMKG